MTTAEQLRAASPGVPAWGHTVVGDRAGRVSLRSDALEYVVVEIQCCNARLQATRHGVVTCPTCGNRYTALVHLTVAADEVRP
jgi:4-hydroxy-3-methylbut-2-en-1-yl diphosphate synthase IspG/GcpE